MIKKFVNRILFPHTCSSENYILWLRKNGCHIGEHTRFISPKSCYVDTGRLEYISIGTNCCLSVVSILAHDYSWYMFAEAYGDVLPDPGGRVVIGNNVFIGYKTIILKNVTIGDNVIIGAGSIVTKDIPSGTVWAGVPAKQISTLDSYYKKKESQRLTDAVYRAQVIKEVKKRLPTVADMGYFAFLFLERTEANWDKYFSDLEFNGIKKNEMMRKLFFKTQPSFDSLEAFLKENNLLD